VDNCFSLNGLGGILETGFKSEIAALQPSISVKTGSIPVIAGA
jgi:hypothetical protein